MIGTKSRVSFLQYMPKKPKKFGIKVWTLADAITGYILEFQIYTGKDRQAEHGLAHRVVMDLVDRYLHQNYHLYTDNFYTSPRLAHDLLTLGTLTCGTCRTEQKNFPLDLKTANLQVGEAIFRKMGTVTCVKWLDKRNVYALSTVHGNSFELVQRQREADGRTKPAIICDYNRYMGGVDLADQFLSYYTLNMRSKKWWKKVFWRLVDIAVVNSYSLYCFSEGKIPQKNFRLDLVLQMVKPYLYKKAAGPSVSTPRDVAQPNQRCLHFLDKRKNNRCQVCHHTTQCHTQWFCVGCCKYMCRKVSLQYHENI